MRSHNLVAGLVNRNIWTEYELEVSQFEWKIPPQMVENDQPKILWDLKIQADW